MSSKHVCLIYNTGRYLYRFRKELIEKLIENGTTVSVIFPFDGYLGKLQELGVQCFDIDMDAHGVNVFKQYSIYKSLKETLNKINPDKILSYTIKPVLFTSVLARKSESEFFPMITGIGRLYIRNDFKTRFIRFVVNLIYKRYFNYNDIVFFQNTDDRDLFVNSGFIDLSKTVMTNGSGVNLDEFNIKDYSKTSRNTVTFLMAGRLDDTKGIYEYLQSVQNIRSRYPADKLAFFLVGGIHESASEDKILSAIKDCDGVEYLGLRDDMKAIYNQASVFVLPSYREGTSRAILEAMACGLPIVTTDVPGCKEPVSNDINGKIVPPRDVNSLCDAMIYFIDNPTEISRMGQKSREIVEDKYDVNLVVQTIVEQLNLTQN